MARGRRETPSGLGGAPGEAGARPCWHCEEIIGYFASIGAASNQIGRAYDYMGYLYKPSKDLLMNIKSNVDPKNKMNTGALGISEDFWNDHKKI